MSIVINNKSRLFISNVIGRYINSPEQRLIQGLTALGLQPVIDYYNHSADDETRAVSVARTIGKIVAGTGVGVLVRYGAIYSAKKFSAYAVKELENGFIKKVGPLRKRDIFMPSINYEEANKTPKEFERMYDNYIKTMGTLLASFAMVFTNFLLDVPITRFVTKKLTPVVRKKIDKEDHPEVKQPHE